MGMIFAHRYEDFRNTQMAAFAQIVKEEGQKILGWREVPIDKSGIGAVPNPLCPVSSRFSLPGMRDCAMTWILKKTLRYSQKSGKIIIPCARTRRLILYSQSFIRTVVYKGMLTAEQLRSFYLDLSTWILHQFGHGAFKVQHQYFPQLEERIPTVISSTTGKSIRCAATSTG